MRARVVIHVIAALLAAGPARAHAAQRLLDVREIATDTLHDVAVARFERGRPVIYYNPELLRRLGPELSAFFLAHEYGHVRRGDGGAALSRAEDGLAEIRQRLELDADCYAARYLAADNPDAVQAALRFFTRLGPHRFDRLHPTGSQRAAKILACLPDTP